VSDEKKITSFLKNPRSSTLKIFPESPAGSIWQENFAKQGFYTWNVTVARRKIVVRITPEDLQNFIDWDTSLIWDHFPSTTDVLTLHGLQDKTVPPWVISLSGRKKNQR